MLRTAFSDDCLSQAVFYLWVKRFKVENLESSRRGRHSTARNEQMVAQMRKKIR
jgi:hypothetical protein